MTQEAPKEFGRRAPPVVLHRPKLPKEPPNQILPQQKRSLAVSLAVVGAVSLGGYGLYEWSEGPHCEPDPNNPDQQICRHSSGSTSHSSRGWHWLSGSSASTHGVSFGGFGHSGGFFGGGG
ncbi:hypothetical protein OGR47_11390 [Methylocystis sp. MJC1]|jgi:uncharacterized membrane protein YgcG|uniref:hypothetical protein n=1 Tax=Methylocystis sp. MJC1 TaxID=2654282 RepID=UPI0013EE2139|nr:hypothetical protein [Methylocystis sp. MJC1]KAF2990163.1 hypothetical protein MJC1_02824 [Methylocystis sp. MJC1]MBU6527586.1 hypothetical protein [Methylocystis sp. MJC1]UZX10525.1 hypothetical protein OGR47_11390 [Methylocystis sp. MJC1]